jgi:hypothetical protein
VSSTQLRAAISSADVASATTAQVSVFNPTPGGGTSNILAFPVESQALTRIGSFAQIASGGGWKTTVTLINVSAAVVIARINFYADDGSPLTLPLVFPRTGSVTTSSFADVAIAANSSIVLASEAPTAAIAVGWADIQASGALSGYSIFRWRSPGLPDSEGTVPLDARLDTPPEEALIIPRFVKLLVFRKEHGLISETIPLQDELSCLVEMLDDAAYRFGIQVDTPDLPRSPRRRLRHREQFCFDQSANRGVTHTAVARRLREA